MNSMSRNLVKAIETVMIREGQTGKGRLADVIGVGTRQIERYVDQDVTPKPDVAYKLAVACGLSDVEALRISAECAPTRQRTA